MKNLLERLLSGATPERTINGIAIDFIKSRKQILKELQISLETGAIVGVYSRALGEGMFLTVVEAIDKTRDEEIITFHRYDLSGHILSRNELGVSEIKMVFPFNGFVKTNLSVTHKIVVSDR